MLRAVVVSSFYPSFSRSGSAARLAQVFEALRNGGAFVHLVFMRFRRPNLMPPRDVDRFVDQISTLNLRGETFYGVTALDLKEAIRPYGWCNGVAHRLCGWLSPAKIRLARIVNNDNPDVVMIDHTFLAPLITATPRCGHRLHVIDTHDVLHMRDESFVQAGFDAEAGVTREEESKLLDPFDVVIAIQDRERHVLQEMVPHKRVVTIEHACEVSAQPCRKNSICFVGSDYFVNVQGILAFIREAWPLVRKRCPESVLELVGGIIKNPQVRDIATLDDRILMRGIVPRVSDIYDGPSVMVCPLWAGSGLKIKMVEALAHGKATVASPTAAEGLEDGCGRAFALAYTPHEFVEPIVSILSDPHQRRRWEAAAAKYAGMKFDPNHIAFKLLNTLFPGERTT